MSKSLEAQSGIALFHGHAVRRIFHEGAWWFVVEDVVVVLTNSSNPKDYLSKMKLRDPEFAKGYGQFVPTLEVQTKGGRQRMNCANVIELET